MAQMVNHTTAGSNPALTANKITHKMTKISRKISRMKLADVVGYYTKCGWNNVALYFKGCANDSVTVDGWIDADFVRRHVGEDRMRELQSEVTTVVYA